MIELNDFIKKEIIEHAERESPLEACGLLSIIGGKYNYHPCRNVSADPADFILDPVDYVRTEDSVEEQAGSIVAVVHSHPRSSAKPTNVDKVGCEVSGLPWVIFSLKNRDWFTFAPSGYKAPLIGREFKHGVFDCYSAMRDWYKEKKEITLKDFDRAEKWWEKGQNLFIDHFQEAGFRQVMDEPKVGDILLMNIASSVVNHCAVYIGDDKIFHQTMNRLSCREIYGGMWKKNTRMVLRYLP